MEHNNSPSQPEHIVWLEIIEWPMIGAYSQLQDMSIPGGMNYSIYNGAESAKNIFLDRFKDNPKHEWERLSERLCFYCDSHAHTMEWRHAQVKRVDLFDGLEQKYIFKGIVGKRYSSMIRLQVESTAFLGELRLPNWSEAIWNPFKTVFPIVGSNDLDDLSIVIHWPESIAVTRDANFVIVPLSGRDNYIHDTGDMYDWHDDDICRRKREIHCNPNSTSGVNYSKPTKSAGKTHQE